MTVLGLKRGTVKLIPHQKEWEINAKETINLLKQLIGDIAIDIQHIGSTSIPTIHAKPIIDIVVGVDNLTDILPYKNLLQQYGVIFRGEVNLNQLLFVIGDMEKDTRTHHIHITPWNGKSWVNYINFRDYLIAFEEKAQIYDQYKQELALKYSNDRSQYTENKNDIIDKLLKEAYYWRKNS
ncbi:UPF0157-domain-containing protein [Neocallimastix lanati (nom. inval.)]|uniref:UPF0157-domain-containing protein n=1 Tax=Neocallimastix californiae TaxID=1754190 RepID=A0A1Y2AU56_9FUNG|nr:UPF0157-domain-containing protein [Neocallimastix sp. JGI-2020a]ORY26123.1 UPF0157-domain-containing protein [Neocallimastix californiae]|eukprot:ORY26123.1 UPF0157-domain-containing protein [Neocallimastix californiae]